MGTASSAQPASVQSPPARSRRSAPEPSAGELAAEAWRRLRSIGNDPETIAAEHRTMHELDLTGGPVKALRCLPLDESISMRALADRMGCDNSYVTSLIDTLEERGLATRETDPRDRRRKAVTLSDAGRVLARRIQQEYVTPPASLAALSRRQLATLCDLLARVDVAGS